MSQDNITVSLPGSKSTAEIRSFIKNKDRRAVRRAIMASQKFDQKELDKAAKKGKDGKDVEMEFIVGGDALTDVMDVQIKCLLVSYDGNRSDPYSEMENSPYEEDMNAVEEAVKSVFDQGSSESSEKK